MSEKEPRVFYAYVSGDRGKKLVDTKIIMKAKQIEDPRTHVTTWDPIGQQVAEFVAGVYATYDKFEIEFLETYNARNPDSHIDVRTEMLLSDGSVAEVKVVSDKFIPFSIVKDLDITSVRKVLKDEFNFTPAGESLKEIFAEAKEKQFFR